MRGAETIGGFYRSAWIAAALLRRAKCVKPLRLEILVPLKRLLRVLRVLRIIRSVNANRQLRRLEQRNEPPRLSVCASGKSVFRGRARR